MGIHTERELSEYEPNKHTISRLSAALRMPGGHKSRQLFIGWNPYGRPIMTSDKNMLSNEAKNSFKISKEINFPLEKSSSKLPIKLVDFVAMSLPIDRRDRGNKMVEDLLVIGVNDEKGDLGYIQLNELDAIKLILNGQLMWEDVNQKTMFKDETLPTLPMYSSFIPGHDADDEKVLYVLLFQPVMENESNEEVYRQFLIQTIDALVKLDKSQTEGAKKGYGRAVERTLNKDSAPGSDAYIVMSILKGFGLPISNDKLNKIRKESSGKSFKYQIMLLAREAGILEFDTPEDYKNTYDKLEDLEIDQLRDVLRISYSIAKSSFKRRR